MVQAQTGKRLLATQIYMVTNHHLTEYKVCTQRRLKLWNTCVQLMYLSATYSVTSADANT